MTLNRTHNLFHEPQKLKPYPCAARDFGIVVVAMFIVLLLIQCHHYVYQAAYLVCFWPSGSWPGYMGKTHKYWCCIGFWYVGYHQPRSGIYYLWLKRNLFCTTINRAQRKIRCIPLNAMSNDYWLVVERLLGVHESEYRWLHLSLRFGVIMK